MVRKRKRNLLDDIPVASKDVCWDVDDQGNVTLHRKNTGVPAWIGQKLFHKPKVSHISLEKFGSYLWQQMDGKKTWYALAMEMKQKFGDEAEPLYERLVPYIRALWGCGCIRWSAQKTDQFLHDEKS